MPGSAQRSLNRYNLTRCSIKRATPAGNTGRSVPMRPACNETADMNRIAVFGGIYSNHLALEVALADAHRRQVDAIYCLGDMGAFGPHPDRVLPLLREYNVQCIQGNYDNS